MFNDGPVQTIQLTGKKWKGLWLFARIVRWVGIFFLLAAITDSNHEAIQGCMWVIIATIPVSIFARFGAWWNHR